MSVRQDEFSLANNSEELPNCSLIATPVSGFFPSKYNPRSVTTKLLSPKHFSETLLLLILLVTVPQNTLLPLIYLGLTEEALVLANNGQISREC